MKIEIVQLENIRSHVKSTVPFTRGFNCLVGGLGCGKSSVLLAIDFALFGDSIGRSFEYLLREGADLGRVTVQFTQNGNTYKLTRGLRRRGKSINQDVEQLKLFEDEKLIASMKTEAIAEQFKAITGLDRDLYREIVWFRQEHLKELLDAKPRDRQTRLDELFGLSDYEVAWSNIAQYQRDYEAEKRVYEKDPDINALENLSNEYNRSSEEYVLLELELDNAAQKLAAAKKSLENADVQVKRVEEKRSAVEELKRKEARLHADNKNMENTLVALSQRIEGKRSILENLLQRQASLDLQVQAYNQRLQQVGVQSDQPLEALSAWLASFDDRISTLKAEQEATFRNMQTDHKRSVQLGQENKCPLCIQPLDGEYKTNLLSRIEHDNLDREKLVNQLKLEVANLQKTKTIASEACSGLASCVTRSADLKARVAEEQTNLNNLQVDFGECQKAQAELKLSLEAAQSVIARFDSSEVEAAKALKDAAFRAFYSLESDLRLKESRKGDLLCRLDAFKDRINLAQEKLERAEKIRRTVEALVAIREAYRSIQPKLRGEFVLVLRNYVQQVLDSLVGPETALLNLTIDETYSPFVKSDAGVNREVSFLSGGERTLVAFAYRLGLGQLIMQSCTGHGLSMLVLDEPTENLGSEDGSIEHLAEAIGRFKAIEQIIAVTHSEAFAAKAEHVVILEKEAGVSRFSIER